MNNKQIGILAIVFGILGILVELLAPHFLISESCLDVSRPKTLQYLIYILVIFIGVQFRRSIKPI